VIELVHRLDEERRREPSANAFSRQSAIMSGETSQPSTSSPSRKYGSSSRPVPHATSSAGCSSASTNLRKHSISGPSTLNSAHHFATSP
jgi:hypothetical protein